MARKPLNRRRVHLAWMLRDAAEMKACAQILAILVATGCGPHRRVAVEEESGAPAAVGSGAPADVSSAADATIAVNTIAVSAGMFHTCIVNSDSTVACWGANFHGEAVPPPGSFIAVDGGFRHTCGIKTDNSLACWGSDEDGRATPPAGSFIAVSASEDYTCSVRQHGGRLVCWGARAH